MRYSLISEYDVQLVGYAAWDMGICKRRCHWKGFHCKSQFYPMFTIFVGIYYSLYMHLGLNYKCAIHTGPRVCRANSFIPLVLEIQQSAYTVAKSRLVNSW